MRHLTEKMRKRDMAANAVLAAGLIGNLQSPQHIVRSGHIEGPGVQLMQRMMKKRKEANRNLDSGVVSQGARNRTNVSAPSARKRMAAAYDRMKKQKREKADEIIRDLRKEQKTFQDFITEASAASTKLANVASQRINQTRDFSVLPQGKPSLEVLSNLQRNAQQRSSGIHPDQSNIRRGQEGAGVPSRRLDPVRIKPSERNRITSREINRRSFEKDANRMVPLTRKEVPVPITSRPTKPSNTSGSRSKTPLTQKIRDQRAAAAGFSGGGSLPSGSKLYRQNARGVSVGDDPMAVLRSAAKS